MIAFLSAVVQLIILIAKVYIEKDSAKASANAELSKEIIDAFSETDVDVRAARINIVINKLRKRK